MAKIKLTTKAGYKNGYEAAENNQPCKSPHRVGTASEELWLAGFNAFMAGGKSPEEPRKRRTKGEIKTDLLAPPKSSLPASLRIRKSSQHYGTLVPRGDGILEKLFKAKKKIETETDPEILEILHMEAADLNWRVCVEAGPLPSTI